MVVKIDYGELESSSKALNKAAKYCGDYASRLRRKVPNELDNLTRGSSNYTSSASYFASAKIQSLEKQQQKCLDVSGKIDTFIKDAKSTDQRVAGIMKKEGNEFRKANGLSFGWADGLMQVITRFTIDQANKDDIRRWISSMLIDVSDAFNAYMLDFKYWYACKGGKYKIEVFFRRIGVIVATLAVIVAAVYLLPIVLAALGIGGVTSTVALFSLKGIVAICNLVTACIALSDAIYDRMYTIKAAKIAETDPGWAARYADISSTKEHLRKTYYGSDKDKFSMIWANIIEGVEIACIVVNVANMLDNAHHFFKGDYRANAVEWKRKFKIWDKDGNFSIDSTVKNWKENIKTLKFAFTHDYKSTQIAGARKRNYAIYREIEKMRDSEPYKVVMKLFDNLEDSIKKFEKYAYSKPT